MLLRDSLHQASGWPVGNLLGRVVPLRVLLGAEIRTGEDFLHTDDLHTLLPRLIEKLEMLLDVGFANFLERCVRRSGMRRLDQATLYDSCHSFLLEHFEVFVRHRLARSPVSTH